MIPEIGHFALILALSLAICQGVLPLLGAYKNDQAMLNVAKPAALGQFAFVAIAFGCLTWSFIQSDFSVLYVANHSQLSLPIPYKISAVWGAHEGSLLLWVLLLSGWTVLVSRYSTDLPQIFSARVIGVLGLLSCGFLLFTLLTSNPFERLIPAPADGADLNPLLQDPGLAIHPPLLYVGYVGFSVAFAFAIAAMISVAVSYWRHCTWQLVGILRTRLGRLVVLGPGGKCVLHAMAGRYRVNPFTCSN